MVTGNSIRLEEAAVQLMKDIELDYITADLVTVSIKIQ